MRFKTRVFLSVVVLLFFTLLCAVHLLTQVGVPEDEGFHRYSGRKSGPNRRPDTQNNQKLPHAKKVLQDRVDLHLEVGGNESQIAQPPLPRGRRQKFSETNHARSSQILQKESVLKKGRRPAWERGSSLMKRWDDQDIVGLVCLDFKF